MKPGFGLPQWVAVAAAGAAVFSVLRWVDLAPRVEGDFFFSRDDPQLRASLEIEDRFSNSPQIIIRAASSDIASPAYMATVDALTDALTEVDGVNSVNSVATADADVSPLWSRLLKTPDGEATNLLAELVGESDQHAAIVERVETVVDAAQTEDFELRISGVPYVLELIRRNLFRDLIVFSTAALTLFGALVALVYRRLEIVVGTLAACLTSCAVTLILIELLNISIGLLTANIATIVFVLTLSHIVFLTSNWRRIASASDGGGSSDAVPRAVRQTLEPSFWAMATTLLGFLSLLIASAKPLRELGYAGAVGALTAMGVAYTLYPVFLRSVRITGKLEPESNALAARLPTTNAQRWLGAFVAIGLISLAGVFRLSTDPSLLTYFAKGSELREGLAAIDRDGGSSPLSVVVADRVGRTLDDDAVVDEMWQLQASLENDPSVGVVVSPPVVLAEIKRQPFMGALGWKAMLDIPLISRVAGGFISPSRNEGVFLLRMREDGRTRTRDEVVRSLRDQVDASGLRPVLVGGLYELQGQLGRLIASSLRIGLGGLLVLFLLIGFAVGRSWRVSLAMVVSLSLVPVFVLGTFGHFGVAIDIISAPAANVAMAMGVDSMIHLVVRARRLRTDGVEWWQSWIEARAQLWYPILGACLIICAGFGIFSLSTFPPTQRFGLLVILGTLTAATMALVALPFGAARRGTGVAGTPTAVEALGVD